MVYGCFAGSQSRAPLRNARVTSQSGGGGRRDPRGADLQTKECIPQSFVLVKSGGENVSYRIYLRVSLWIAIWLQESE